VKISGKGAEIREVVFGKGAASPAAIVAVARAFWGTVFIKESG
jgi:hypothetical protein